MSSGNSSSFSMLLNEYDNIQDKDKVGKGLTCCGTFLSGKVLADEIIVCFFFWLLTFLTYETFSDINYAL